MTFHDVRRRAFMSLVAGASFLSILGGPAWAADQQPKQPSLAEIAKKELERRKAITVPAKVFTEKDVKPSAIPPPAPATGEQAAPTTPPAGTGEAAAAVEKAPEATESKGEAYWRGRITEARENLRRNEVFAEALQSRINGLTTEFSAKDDPFQRGKVAENRDNALAEQARVRAEIVAAKALIATIEEEARKAGVPPAWLR